MKCKHEHTKFKNAVLLDSYFNYWVQVRFDNICEDCGLKIGTITQNYTRNDVRI